MQPCLRPGLHIPELIKPLSNLMHFRSSGSSVTSPYKVLSCCMTSCVDAASLKKAIESPSTQVSTLLIGMDKAAEYLRWSKEDAPKHLEAIATNVRTLWASYPYEDPYRSCSLSCLFANNPILGLRFIIFLDGINRRIISKS